jgi:4-oxalocrotonate tautomerase
MPILQFDGPLLSPEKKEELIKSLTKTSAEILELPEQAFSIIIRENDPKNIGVGGEVLAKRSGK